MQNMRKVALVTGGTRGIGLGISKKLADEGYALALCGMREESQVPTLQELRDTGAEVWYTPCNVADRQAREAMIEGIRSHYGALNLLVNNAGIAPRERNDILDASEESFEELIRTNLQGPYFLTQSVARWMIEQKEADSSTPGCIVNITSISADTVSLNRGEYCISKAGSSMGSQLWAARLGEYDIPVYEIRPGITATDMTSGVKEKYDKLISEGLLVQPRWGYPEDIGKAVAMLARGDLAYASGQIITLDGGLGLKRL
jgi:NAD(P)-dependent dehydrogenase (short-subunit alcohol dehydrogenase family)